MSAPPVPNATAVVSHRYPYSAEEVFDAWLEPKTAGSFMFGYGAQDETLLHAKIDPKVGGRFSFLVLRDGQKIDHLGEYLKLDRPKTLAFTWSTSVDEDSSQVTLEVRPVDGGCELTLRHQVNPQWAAFVGQIGRGWAEMLEALAKALAKTKGKN